MQSVTLKPAAGAQNQSPTLLRPDAFALYFGLQQIFAKWSQGFKACLMDKCTPISSGVGVRAQRHTNRQINDAFPCTSLPTPCPSHRGKVLPAPNLTPKNLHMACGLHHRVLSRLPLCPRSVTGVA